MNLSLSLKLGLVACSLVPALLQGSESIGPQSVFRLLEKLTVFNVIHTSFTATNIVDELSNRRKEWGELTTVVHEQSVRERAIGSLELSKALEFTKVNVSAIQGQLSNLENLERLALRVTELMERVGACELMESVYKDAIVTVAGHGASLSPVAATLATPGEDSRPNPTKSMQSLSEFLAERLSYLNSWKTTSEDFQRQVRRGMEIARTNTFGRKPGGFRAIPPQFADIEFPVVPKDQQPPDATVNPKPKTASPPEPH